jgi:hypothetical protein
LKQKSSMKKTTKKTVAAAKAVAKPVAKAAVKVAVKAVKAAKSLAAPAKKKTGEPPVTFISAQVDIGFGNLLYIRGAGPGLSWDRGLPMDCVGTGLWTVGVKSTGQPVVFKVLVNDLSWSSGEDFVVAPGQSVTITPSF